MKASFAFVTVTATLLAGCSYLPSGPTAHPLTGKTWRLTEVETEGGTTRLTRAQQATHTIRFNTDGTMQLQLDCNNGTATWNGAEPVRGEGYLNISAVASTRALCPPPTWGNDLALDLPSTTSYSIAPNGRSIRITARRVSFGFEAQ
ncbi:MAG: META domain-containing protein [Erythrobacter sp.]|nr:META domain-containing protein [Erythrobacter sp.]